MDLAWGNSWWLVMLSVPSNDRPSGTQTGHGQLVPAIGKNKPANDRPRFWHAIVPKVVARCTALYCVFNF